MQRLRIIGITILAVLLLAGTASAAREVEDYSQTINDFKKSSDVAPFFDTAYGYAVFPNIGKAGLGIGGSHGKGQVYKGGEVTGFTSLTHLSVGFQAGGQAYSQVVFFEDESAYNSFTSGNFEFDASASAIAVTASAGASASTEGSGAGASSGGSGGSHATAGYRKGMLVFVIGKGGLMYDASIGGQKYSFKPAE
jgi:lipid-binding SYLF domain-containing protein